MALSLFGNGWPWSSLGGPSRDPFDLIDHSLFKSLAPGARDVGGARVDWLETEDAHVFKADLPGIKKEDLKVQLEDERILNISGERDQEEVKNGDAWHAVERFHGKFLRRFKLPDNAQVDALSAKVVDGVLTVTVPKVQTKKAETKTIDVA